ncbi:MAG: GTP-binding protein [Cyanobacteria bacterium P01_H01_bin.15]
MSAPSPHPDYPSTDCERAWSGLRALQSELNYQQAQQALRHLLDRIDLTQRERRGLEQDIDRLSLALDKLDQSVVQIAAFGLVGRGKSSVLNALIGQDIFETGSLHGVTKNISQADWQPETLFDLELQRASFSEQQIQIQLIDTPGLDEIGGESRAILAQHIATQVDLILFVIAGDITQVEFSALSQLREAGKPLLLVFNKIDQYPDIDRQRIYQKLCDERVKELLTPSEIVLVAASPLLTIPVLAPDGSKRFQRKRSTPNISTLQLKILELLAQEGKSLVALNSMLLAANVSEQVLMRKLEIREQAANQLIDQISLTKALAVALNPVTVMDLFSGAIFDVAMILKLSQLYGINMTHANAISLLQKIGLAMGSISAGELLVTLGFSSLKGLLGAAIPASGGLSFVPYLSVAITQGSIAGVSTAVIGQITKTYLINGETWGPDGPHAVVQNILNSLDKTSILHRLKADLQTRLLSPNTPVVKPLDR